MIGRCRRLNSAWYGSVFGDIRFAGRLLRRSPLFAVTAVLTLGLGIGATLAVFTLLYGVLFRHIAATQPSQLWEIARRPDAPVSYPLYEMIRDHTQVFSGVLLVGAGRFAASAQRNGEDLGDVQVSIVSAEYFDVLGVSVQMGRTLADRSSQTDAAVISHRFWIRSLGGTPSAIGQPLRVGRRAYVVTGVAPPGFSGVVAGQSIDVWVPIDTWVSRKDLNNPGAMMFRLIGRQRTGFQAGEVRSDLSRIARYWTEKWKVERHIQFEVTSAASGVTSSRSRFAKPLYVLMIVTGLLLIMTVTNVMSLTLARGSARQSEIGCRMCLGASRGRIVVQMLSESALLTSLGSAVAVCVAPIMSQYLVTFLSRTVGKVELPFRINGGPLIVGVCVLFGIAVVVGLTPALMLTRYSGSMSLRETVAAGRSSVIRRQKYLLFGQVVVSSVLLTGAVLFWRSYDTMRDADLGFHRGGVVTLHVNVLDGGPTGVQRVAAFEELRQSLQSLPDVQAAAFSSEALFSGNAWTEAVGGTGLAAPRTDREAVVLVISPAYFKTMGIQVIEGREFNTSDTETALPVAIINQAVARLHFGHADPIGRTLRIEHTVFPQPLRIVGLVQSAKYASVREAPTRIVYVPARQFPEPVGRAHVAVKTIMSGLPPDVLWRNAQRLSAHGATLRLAGSDTLDDVIDNTMIQDRLLSEVSAVYGIAAIILVCMGLYGLSLFQVAHLTADIGIRMALGARPADVARELVWDIMKVVSAGVVCGLVAAMVLGRIAESLLFNLRSTDPITLAIATVVMTTLGAMAVYLPAWRISMVEPLKLLRRE